MFIKKLFRHSKVAAICFLSFIAAFLYLNYKWGIIASPIYQLGMFSGVMHKNDTQSVYTVYVDDQPLILNNRAFIHNDMLLVALTQYENHQEHNKEVMDVFNRLSHKIKGTDLPATFFTNTIKDEAATEWFKQLLSRTGVTVRKLSVSSNKYVWDKQQLKPTSSPEIKTFIVNH